MSGKITLEITKGVLAGKTFDYEEQTRLFIGRQEDCGIVLPENTVSRYHCILEIAPPEVKLQDFGSLNGTFLNGNKIGQRDREQSWEQAKDEYHKEYTLHDGDVLGLGSKCEFSIHIEAAVRCAVCGKALSESSETEGTVLEGEEDASAYYNDAGERICADCHLIAERERAEKLIAARKAKEAEEQRLADAAKKAAQAAEQARKDEQAREKERQRQAADKQKQAEAQAQRKRDAEERRKAEAQQKRLEEEARAKEEAAKQAEQARKRAQQQRIEAEKLAADMAAQIAERPQPEHRKCVGCGKTFTPKAPDNNLCDSCLADPAKILDAILNQFIADVPVKPKPELLEGYEQVSLLGKGGMGEVWKVKERKTGKYYALKTMLPRVATDEHAKRLFLREASVCQCLKHKNVVKAYKTGSANGTFYILMDLCEGGSVDSLMEQKGGKLSLELATYIILQVLSGLDYVHNMDIDVEIKKGLFRGTKEVQAKGVVHRDFKPGNIFLSDKSDHPVAMVADFGMAKAFNTAGLSSISKTGDFMGTPVFMPRQQAMNFKYSHPEVDVWAAAASYYNMLTGAFPKNFRADKNPWQVIVSEPAVPIRERNGNVSQKLAAVIDRALVEKPEIYYKTAAEFRRDIVAALPDNVRAYVKGVL